jgi:hypothetical protein
MIPGTGGGTQVSGFFLTEEGNVGSQISLEDYPVASGCGEEGRDAQLKLPQQPLLWVKRRSKGTEKSQALPSE